MSLVSALYGSPVPMDVYIALRSDGARGSGSEDDPYSGGLWNSPIFTITAASATYAVPSFYTVTVTIGAHSFAVNDIIEISGFAGADGELLNGKFKVSGIGATTLSYLVIYGGAYNQMPPLSATINVTGAVCRLDPYLFDAVMRALPKTVPVTVHLGPGVFQTKGYNDFYRRSVSWRALPGMKIRGSGIGVTTLQLVGATYRHVSYYLIGSPGADNPTDPNYPGVPNVADGFEASDFTLDGNIVSQPSQKLTVGAMVIRGSNTLLRRLRIINWGRQGSYADGIGSEINSPECFPVLVGSSSYANTPGYYQSKNCVVEECIVEQPAMNYAAEGTMIGVLTGDSRFDANSGLLPLPTLGSVIRNCFINCEYQVNPVPVASVQWISYITSGAPPKGTLTVQIATTTAHGLTPGQWVRVAGVYLSAGSQFLNNPYNGSFKVTSVPSATQLQYESKELLADPGAPDAGQRDVWVGRFPSDYIKLKQLSALTQRAGTNIYDLTVETSSPHFLIESPDPIPAGGPPQGSVGYFSGLLDATGALSRLNGLWTVKQWISNTMFACWKDFTGLSPAPTLVGLQSSEGQMGTTFQGLGEATVVEGNVVTNCARGGPYIDTWGAKELVIRNNLYRRVRLATHQSLIQPAQQDSFDRPKLSWISTAGTTARFHVKSGLPHYLTVGQGVLLFGFKDSLGVLIPIYNRSYKVAAIPNPTDFEVILDGSASNPDNSFEASYEYLWETYSCIVEGNIVEMFPAFNNSIGASYGVLFNAVIPDRFLGVGWPTINRDFKRFRRVVTRNNRIDYAAIVDGVPYSGIPGFIDTGIFSVLMENGSITNNQISVGLANDSRFNTIRDYKSGTLYYFNNRTPAGSLIEGAPLANSARYPEVTTVIDDALALSLL